MQKCIDWTTFNPLSWLLISSLNAEFLFFFFDTRWHTLVNVTFSCVQKVRSCVFEQTPQKLSKLVKYKLKYEEFWSVYLFNAASSGETWKVLTYNNFLISCCIQPKLVSTPPFSMIENLHCCSLFEWIWTLGGTLSCLEARRFANFEQITI